MIRCDIAIVGAGIAGASLAAELAPFAGVVVVEAEAVAGYHATGRSAAFWSETYGGPAIQPLTTASHAGLAPFLAPLGSLHIGRAADAAKIDAFVAEFADSGVVLEQVEPASLVPGLRTDWSLGVREPSSAYIDVAALQADCLVKAKRAGARLLVDAPLTSATWSNGEWRIAAGTAMIVCDILVNAAGAWADRIAELAGARKLGIRPYRRTMAQLRTAPAAPPNLPHVADISGAFYFKPEHGRVWLSPHDEIATDPCDAQPEEIDVATAIDRFEGVVDWQVEAVERRWAGLRSFAPDRLPVYGFAAEVPRFFWCAGQGGFGIQTAPAAAAMAAAVLLGRMPPLGLDPARYAPARFA